MKTLAVSLIIAWFVLIMSIVTCIIYKLLIQDSNESDIDIENQLEE